MLLSIILLFRNWQGEKTSDYRVVKFLADTLNSLYFVYILKKEILKRKQYFISSYMRKLKLRNLPKATLLLSGEAWIPIPIIIFPMIFLFYMVSPLKSICFDCMPKALLSNLVLFIYFIMSKNVSKNNSSRCGVCECLQSHLLRRKRQEYC